MSSFRIDRQYVSFEPVETHHVYMAEQASDGSNKKFDFKYGKTDKNPENIEAYCADMIGRAQNEAEERALRIVTDAEKEAEEILGSAKMQAGRIIGEAKSSAAGIRESARAEGYAQCRKDAEAEAEARKIEEAKELQSLAAKLRSDYSGLVDGMQRDVISLIIEITKKIINVKLKESDEVFIGLINDAIERLKQSGYLIIRVSPEDYARYFGSGSAEKNIITGEAKVVVSEEDGFSPGDLVVESDGEMLDLSINRQIEKVEKAFTEEGS